MKKHILLLALFFAVLFFFASCGDISPKEVNVPPESTDDPHDDLPDTPDPRLPGYTASEFGWEDDGILRLPMRPPLTLNPLLNRDITVARILNLIFEPLAVLDENLRVVGHLADLEFALDFSGVVITIKNEAIWSDGLPVTSDDFIFSVETLANAPDDAIYRNQINNIASYTRIDDRTVHVFFEHATPTAGYALLFPLIQRNYYRIETNPASPRNMSPLGNGLYMFESITPLQAMTLVRNPNTFRRQPAIERVEVLLLPDEQIDMYAFDRGLVDAIRLPLPEWVRKPTTKALHADQFPAMYFEFVGFNFSREVFNDMAVRQGIAHAFDADEAIDTLYLHHAKRASTPIHPAGWMFDASVSGLPHDPNRARELLLAVPGDEPLVIIVGEDNPERTAIAFRLGLGLEEAGLTVEVETLPADEFLARLTDDDYDLFVGWMELSYAPDFVFMFGGERMGGVLFGHDPLLEELFAVTRVATTESAFINAVSQLQHAFAERLPVLGLAFRHSAVLMSTRVQVSVPPAPCSVFIYVNEWKLRN
jgi:peptide/nickel transport system substrate-binding protein